MALLTNKPSFYLLTTRYLLAAVVMTLLVGCGVKGKFGSRLGMIDKCKTNPSDPFCLVDNLGKNFFVVEGDRIEVTFTLPDEDNGVSVVGGGLKDMEVMIPAGAFTDELTLVAEYEQKYNFLVAPIAALLGYENTRVVTMTGSQELRKEITVTLPSKLSADLSVEQMAVVRIRGKEKQNENVSSLRIYPHENIDVSGDKGLLTFMMLKWAEFSVVADVVPPVTVITSTSAAISQDNPIVFTITFNEEVADFTANDLVIVNGNGADFSGSGLVYSINVTPLADGDVVVKVPVGKAKDMFGNLSAVEASLTRRYDSTRPSVALTSTANAITNLAAIPVTVTFSEEVNDFDVSDLIIDNGSASNFSGSGASYSFDLVPAADGPVSVDIADSAAIDAAGHLSLVAAQFLRTYDGTAPTVTLSSTAPASTATTPIPVTITFSEDVTDFIATDITVGNGSVTNFSGSGAVYSFDLVPAAQGSVTVDIAADVAEDGGANGNDAAAQFVRAYDSVAPTVAITSTAPANTNVAPIPVTVTFSENVTGFVSGDVTIGNGTIANFSGSGTTYTFDVTPSGQGSVTVDINSGVAIDAAGNNNTAATQLARTYDSVKPTVSVTSAASSPTNTSPIPVTVTFSEDVTGFVVGDLTLGNGTASNFSGSGTTYTFDLTPAGQGNVTVDIVAGVAADAADNTNTVATQLLRVYDNGQPSVTISSTAPASTNVSPIPVTVTFSEDVADFVVGDLTLGNGAASNFSGSGTTYTFDLTPSGQGNVTVDVAAGVATDTAGNNNTVATQLLRVYDTVQPTVTLSTTAPTNFNTSPIVITVTFSEDVTGFVVGDLTLGNAAASNFSGSGTTYTFDLTPSSQGSVTVDVAAGVAADAATNTNTVATQLTRNYNNTQPSVVISSAAPAATKDSPIPVTVTFSVAVTGFVVGDLTLGNGTASNFSGSGTTYTFDLTPSGQGAVTVDIDAGVAEDVSANTNTAAAQFARTYDTVQPTVVITSTAPASTNVSPIPVTVTFSEDVTDFVVGDLTLGNGTASNFSGSGATYTFDLTPAGQGDVTVDVAAGVAADAATNTNTSAAQLIRTYDTAGPTVVITSNAAAITNLSPFTVTVTFSEDVTGFVVGDVTLGNGSASNFAGSGTTYTFDLTPAGQGSVTVDVASGVATDASNNGNSVATQYVRSFDSVKPNVTLSSSASAVTATSPIPVTVTFSEDVTGFVVGDLTLDNGTASNFSGSGATYTFDLTPSGQGVVKVDVAAGVAADAATNTNNAATQLTRTYDSAGPTVVITSNAAADTNLSPFAVTITFSEDVTTFDVSDVTLGNGSATNFSGSGAVYTFDLTPGGQGNVTIDVAAGKAIDAAGNQNTAATQYVRNFDSVKPGVTLSSTAPATTSTSPIPVTITFSEAVTGFVVGDLTLDNGTASNFSGSGTTYTFDLTPSGQGDVTVDVAAGVAADAATNTNTAATQLLRHYDTDGPTVAITSAAPTNTNTSPIPITITFSESVTGFAVGDITVGNGSAGNLSGSGTTYTAEITPSAVGDVTIDIDAGVAKDAADNDNQAATQIVRNYNNVQPTVAITSSTSSVTNVSPIPVTITFSKAVTNFVVGDITVAGGSKANFSGSGTTYTFDLTPSGPGSVTVDVDADVANDAHGNNNTAAVQLTRTYDNVGPTVAITSAAASTFNTAPISVSVTFSEPVTGFNSGDLTLGNGSVTNFAGTGASYTFDLTPSGQGAVTVDIATEVAQDSAGNDNSAATQFSRTYDNVGPTVAITSAAPASTKVSPIPVTVTFSETVTDFVVGDLTLANGSASNFSGSGTTYTFDLTPSAQGDVTVDIASGVAHDAVGNDNSAATQLARVYDTTGPTAGGGGTLSASNILTTSLTLSWSKANDALAAQDTLQYEVRVSTSNNLSTVSDAETNGTIAQAYSTDIATANITGLTIATTYYFNVIVKDPAGNKSLYSTTSAATVDTTPPVPGNSGTITTASVTATTMTLNWTKATDAVTAQANLQYEVRQSSANNMTNVADAESNGTIIRTYTADISTFAVTGLSPSSTYYFNVIVKDAAGNKAAYTTKSQATTADTTQPTVSPTTITISNIASSSVTLSWTKATDNVTPQADLQYQVRRSLSNNLSSVANIEANGTIIQDYTADISTLNVTGLAADTTHYFNIIVKDAAGNKRNYTAKSQATLPAPIATVNTSSAVSSSTQRKSFYDADNERHWAFYYNGAAIEYAYSADKVNWTVVGQLAYNTPDFATTYKDFGSGYLFLAVTSGHDILLLRGGVDTSSISFDAPVVVFDGTGAADSYSKPSVMLSGFGEVWVAAIQCESQTATFNHQVRVRRSSDNGYGDLSSWEVTSAIGSKTTSARGVVLLPRSGSEMYALVQGTSVEGYLYDGTTWSAAGEGGQGYSWLTFPGSDLHGNVLALAVLGTDLYVGGQFTQAGGAAANRIAKWDGDSWSALGSGVSNTVYALAVLGTDLYVGGAFTQAGGAAANRIAKWDGDSWSAVGSGFVGIVDSVNALAVLGTDLYAGGKFAIWANHIAKWDGSSWSALGSGVSGYVNALAVLGTDLYVGGQFTQAGGAAASYIAKWDGGSWSALGSGVSSTVNALAVLGTDLYVGGNFTQAGGAGIRFAAKWNSGWSSISNQVALGLSSSVTALAVLGTDLYVGGYFTHAGGAEVNRIAKWDGDSWSALGSGVNGTVRALAVLGTDLYVGGEFTQAGGAAANRIAKWDGSSWSALGIGVSGYVNALTVLGTDLYVGGNFTQAGGAAADYVAKWAGGSWSPLGSGVNSFVHAFAVLGTDLYVGGAFTQAGGAAASFIAKWDGDSWSALGSGVSSTVNALAVLGTDLYVGGNFTQAGGAAANRIAKWDGDSWSALGSGVAGIVQALTVLGTDLYVGGGFTQAGGAAANRIAKWDGSSWSALGSGVNSGVNALAVLGTDLYLGGAFTAQSNNNITNYLAARRVTSAAITEADEISATSLNGTIHLQTTSSTGGVHYLSYDPNGDGWSVPTSLSASNAATAPTISYHQSTGDLFAFWIESSMVKTRRYTTSWAVATNFFSYSGIVPTSINSDISSDDQSADETIKVLINATNADGKDVYIKTTP